MFTSNFIRNTADKVKSSFFDVAKDDEHKAISFVMNSVEFVT